MFLRRFLALSILFFVLSWREVFGWQIGSFDSCSTVEKVERCCWFFQRRFGVVCFLDGQGLLVHPQRFPCGHTVLFFDDMVFLFLTRFACLSPSVSLWPHGSTFSFDTVCSFNCRGSFASTRFACSSPVVPLWPHDSPFL